MLACIFTLDYEIYGNGEGSLNELVYQPTERLLQAFSAAEAPFVCFVEAAELERIEEECTDAAIVDIRRQVARLHSEGHEIALHIHPQWYDARYLSGRWILNYDDYNLCTLSRERIAHMVDRAIAYLRKLLQLPDFVPVSFRAGNWLFQPTKNVASVLVSAGVGLDSSVFKGGLQRRHGMDYRRARENGSHWSFSDDVNEPDRNGMLLEIPIYTEMVPFWSMLTEKRLGLQSKGCNAGKSGWQRFARIRDFLRPLHPRKFDFCRMTLGELVSMTDRLIRDDKAHPDVFTPIVAIGHSKDLVDFKTIEAYLTYLKSRGIAISTLEDAYRRYSLETLGAGVQ